MAGEEASRMPAHPKRGSGNRRRALSGWSPTRKLPWQTAVWVTRPANRAKGTEPDFWAGWQSTSGLVGATSGGQALGCDEHSLVFDYTSRPCRRVKRPPLQCLRVKSVHQFFGTKAAEGGEKGAGVNCSFVNAVNRFLHD